jgi:hypothetical protein
MSVQLNQVDKEDIRLAYEATVNYHNTLVQMRFAVASFFAAAAAFLVGAVFAESTLLPNKIVISILGLAVTIIIWTLEVRTYCLLRNLCKIGLEYEEKFNLGNNTTGFFSLLSKNQPISVRLPFFHTDIPSTPFVRRFFSHSFGLDCFYFSFVIFWSYILIIGK